MGTTSSTPPATSPSAKVKAGATLRSGTEAVEPLVEDGLVRGAVLHDKDDDTHAEVRARYLVVADGSNSRFGRALGAARDRSYPMGMAVRGYFESPRHDDPWTSATRRGTTFLATGGSSRSATAP